MNNAKNCPMCGRECGISANFCGQCKYNFQVPAVPKIKDGSLGLSNAKLPNFPIGMQLSLAGAFGGFVGHALSFLAPYDSTLSAPETIGRMLINQSCLSMFGSLGIIIALLIASNYLSLRGHWSRDLILAVPLSLCVGFLAGFVGILFYWVIGVTRGLPWALSGAAIGAAIGFLRKDKVQSKQGALGGLIGGLIGGILIDIALSVSYTDATFSLFSRIGTAVSGALIGLFIYLAQNTLKTAWIVGVTPGFYENKEYPLNKKSVTVGKSELDDIVLYQKSELPIPKGAFVQSANGWIWEGEAITVNGTEGTQLRTGDIIRLGNTDFRFMLKPKAAT